LADAEKLVPYVWEWRWRVLLALAFLVAAKLANVGVPLVLKNLVDALDLKPGDPRAALAVPVALLLAYGALRLSITLFTELREFLFYPVAARVARRVSLETFSHLLNLSLRFHLERQTGGVSRDIERGSRSIQSLLNFTIYNILPTLFEISLVILLLSAKFDGWFALITFGALVTYIAFTVSVTEWRTHFRRAMNEQDSKASTKAIDALLNYETVKSFGNEAFEHARYDENLQLLERASVKSQTSLSALNLGQSLIIATAVTLLVWRATEGVVAGTMTLGDLVLVNALMIQLWAPLNFLGVIYREIKQSLIDLEKMWALLGAHREVADRPGAPDLVVRGPAVRFEDVRFAYDPDREILAGVSFEIRRQDGGGGRRVRLGQEHAGPAAVPLYDVDAGRITLEARPSGSVRSRACASRDRHRAQDTVLFKRHRRYNIAYGPPARLARPRSMARRGAASDPASSASAPKGYETPSVGEARSQALRLARSSASPSPATLLKRPADPRSSEATSALDSANERRSRPSCRAPPAPHGAGHRAPALHRGRRAPDPGDGRRPHRRARARTPSSSPTAAAMPRCGSCSRAAPRRLRPESSAGILGVGGDNPTMPAALTIVRPDDWHLHVRDGAALQAVVPHSARQFARAVIMPNLRPPVVRVEEALAYRRRIVAAVPPGLDFQPLMTLYLTDSTPPQAMREARQAGIVAIKLYPAGATTNSDAGVTDLRRTYATLESAQREGIVLLVHGEVTDPEVDVFDREAVFIERHLAPLRREFPELKIVLEHITTREGAQYVAAAGSHTGAHHHRASPALQPQRHLQRRHPAALLLSARAQARNAPARPRRCRNVRQRPLLPRHRQCSARRAAKGARDGMRRLLHRIQRARALRRGFRPRRCARQAGRLCEHRRRRLLRLAEKRRDGDLAPRGLDAPRHPAFRRGGGEAARRRRDLALAPGGRAGGGMIDRQRIALLIDADGMSLEVIGGALELIRTRHGAIHIRRCYCSADFATKNLAFLREHGIRAMVNATSGKNCTDIALAIDAVELCGEETPGRGGDRRLRLRFRAAGHPPARARLPRRGHRPGGQDRGRDATDLRRVRRSAAGAQGSDRRTQRGPVHRDRADRPRKRSSAPQRSLARRRRHAPLRCSPRPHGRHAPAPRRLAPLRRLVQHRPCRKTSPPGSMRSPISLRASRSS
jgi:ATP-binding cassette subfamily B protein